MDEAGFFTLHLETTVMATTVKRMIAPTTRHDREVATAVTFPRMLYRAMMMALAINKSTLGKISRIRILFFVSIIASELTLSTFDEYNSNFTCSVLE